MDLEGLEIRQLMASQVFTQYPIPTPSGSVIPAKIALAPDGSLWFGENGISPAALGRITTSGDVSQPVTLSADDATFGLTSGPDNNLYTTEQGGTPAVAQVVPTATGAASTEYTNFAAIPGNPDATHNLESITRGPQGDTSYVWFADNGSANAIGRVDVNGLSDQSIQEFPLAANRVVGTEITAGPAGDDGIYFLETAAVGSQSYIGRIDDTTGAITEFPVTNPDGVAPGTPTSLAAGPGDAIYFTESNTGRIGKLDLAKGVVDDDFFTIPDVTFPGSSVGFPVGPQAIAEFPDGSLYITESNVGSVARLSVGATGSVAGFFQYNTIPGLTGGLPGIASDLDGNPWFTEQAANAIGNLAVASAPLQAQPVAIGGVVDQPLTNIPVATFTDPDGPSPSTQYRATINWGDGTPLDSNTTLSPIGPSDSFQVLASHTYTTSGKFTATVTITDLASPRTATVFDQAGIGVSPVGPSSTVHATAGTPLLGATVARFPVTAATAAGYQATIDWGDGTALGGATFGFDIFGGALTADIIAAHTFSQPGTYEGSVTLRNPDGSLTAFPLQSIVSSLTSVDFPGAPIVIGLAGQPTIAQQIVQLAQAASFPTPNPTNYSATIDWGDGSPSTAAQVTSGLGIVVGPHAYASPGSYTIRYTLGDAGTPDLLSGTGSAQIGTLTGSPIAPSGMVGQPLSSALGQQVPLEMIRAVPVQDTPVALRNGGYYSATIDYGLYFPRFSTCGPSLGAF